MEEKNEKKNYSPLPADKTKLLLDLASLGVTKTDLAKMIGISDSLLRSVFEKRLIPKEVKRKVLLFIKNQGLEKDSLSEADLKDLAGKITSPMPLDNTLLEKIKKFMQEKSLNKNEAAKIIGLPRSTFKDSLAGGKASFKTRQKLESFFKKKRPKPINRGQQIVPGTLTSDIVGFLEDADIRVERIKHLLLALELDLLFFVKASKKERDAFRKSLDADDVGYITSVLTALTLGDLRDPEGAEGKFKRWLDKSTYQFRRFRKKG